MTQPGGIGLRGSWLGRLANRTELPIIVFTVALVVILSATIDGFLSYENLQNISRQIAVISLISVGMTLAILVGGIDLSVGVVMSLAISVGGLVGIAQGWPIALVYALVLGVGLVLGLINGVLINNLKVHALIVTLATLYIYRGIVMVVTEGRLITGISPEYGWISQGLVPLVLVLAVTLLAMGLAAYTRIGRHVYAVGGGETAAEYSGIPVRRIRLFVYGAAGFLSALAGLVLIGRSGFIEPQVGSGYELAAIGAVVIGGTSIFGGRGTVLGSLFGSIAFGCILAGMTMLSIAPFWQGAIQGTLILCALALDTIRNRRRGGAV